MAFTKLSKALHLPRLHGSGDERYTDKNEFLSPGVLIAFKARAAGGYPTDPMKYAVNRAAIQARNIVRIANDVMAKVVIMRKDETPNFTATMARHFNLIAGNLAGGYLVDNVVNKPFSPKAVFRSDRRWALEKIRQKMLSLSTHLNTGVYLFDMDTAARTVQDGTAIAVGTSIVADGYVYRRGGQKGFAGLSCGFRNGNVHIDFNDFPNYSLNSCARIIIHEAAHKFLGVGDTFYANNVNYPPSLEQCLHDNADSFAWGAVSLATGTVALPTAGSPDWNNCPGAAL